MPRRHSRESRRYLTLRLFFLVIPRDIALTLDILLVRMTSDSVRPPDKRYGYPNAFTGLLSLIKEEGLRGLARGLAPNTVR